MALKYYFQNVFKNFKIFNKSIINGCISKIDVLSKYIVYNNSTKCKQRRILYNGLKLKKTRRAFKKKSKKLQLLQENENNKSINKEIKDTIVKLERIYLNDKKRNTCTIVKRDRKVRIPYKYNYENVNNERYTQKYYENHKIFSRYNKISNIKDIILNEKLIKNMNKSSHNEIKSQESNDSVIIALETDPSTTTDPTNSKTVLSAFKITDNQEKLTESDTTQNVLKSEVETSGENTSSSNIPSENVPKAPLILSAFSNPNEAIKIPSTKLRKVSKKEISSNESSNDVSNVSAQSVEKDKKIKKDKNSNTEMVKNGNDKKKINKKKSVQASSETKLSDEEKSKLDDSKLVEGVSQTKPLGEEIKLISDNKTVEGNPETKKSDVATSVITDLAMKEDKTVDPKIVINSATSTTEINKKGIGKKKEKKTKANENSNIKKAKNKSEEKNLKKNKLSNNLIAEDNKNSKKLNDIETLSTSGTSDKISENSKTSSDNNMKKQKNKKVENSLSKNEKDIADDIKIKKNQKNKSSDNLVKKRKEKSLDKVKDEATSVKINSASKGIQNDKPYLFVNSATATTDAVKIDKGIGLSEVKTANNMKSSKRNENSTNSDYSKSDKNMKTKRKKKKKNKDISSNSESTLPSKTRKKKKKLRKSISNDTSSDKKNVKKDITNNIQNTKPNDIRIPSENKVFSDTFFDYNKADVYKDLPLINVNERNSLRNLNARLHCKMCDSLFDSCCNCGSLMNKTRQPIICKKMSRPLPRIICKKNKKPTTVCKPKVSWQCKKLSTLSSSCSDSMSLSYRCLVGDKYCEHSRLNRMICID